MLARQTGSGCSDEYRVQPGDPCVPAGTEDVLSCPDLEARYIEVVGHDVFDLDGNDGDGWACERGPDPRLTPDPTGTDLGSYTEPVGVAVLVAIGAGAAVLLWRHRRGARSTERRAFMAVIYATVALGTILVALGLVVTG